VGRWARLSGVERRISVTLKVLIVLTSHAQMGATSEPTGFWLEEFTTPYYTFVDAGAQVEVVSIKGGKAPIDPRSLQADAGGHGTIWDLPDSSALATLAAGRKVAGFTNSEEQAVGLAQVVPFLLETRLRELGGRYESGPDFQPFAIADGNLVTGQNPASSGKAAELALAVAQRKAR
jgi:putative intracellular protease/amidase